MAAAHAQSSSAHEIGVDAHDAVYVLNPSGDLAHTQDTFQGLFQQQPGWQVKPIAPARYSDLHILWLRLKHRAMQTWQRFPTLSESWHVITK